MCNIPLDNVFVPANSTAVSDERITDTRYDTERCGVISSISEFDTSTLNSQMNAWSAEKRTEFESWVASLKDILDEETAGHLQTEIEALQTKIENFGSILDTAEEIEANTQSNQLAGALGVKEGLAAIKSSISSITSSISSITSSISKLESEGTKMAYLNYSSAQQINGGTSTANFDGVLCGSLQAPRQSQVSLSVNGKTLYYAKSAIDASAVHGINTIFLPIKKGSSIYHNSTFAMQLVPYL